MMHACVCVCVCTCGGREVAQKDEVRQRVTREGGQSLALPPEPLQLMLAAAHVLLPRHLRVLGRDWLWLVQAECLQFPFINGFSNRLSVTLFAFFFGEQTN